MSDDTRTGADDGSPDLGGRQDGRRDIVRAVADLRERLPEVLAPLARLAFNYRWSWMPGGPDVFRDMDPSLWERSQGNPRAMIETLPPHRLKELGTEMAADAHRASRRAISSSRSTQRAAYPASLSYQLTTLKKRGFSWMPAPASKMLLRRSPTKSLDTTCSSV
jgi:hypothetical protein